MDTGISLNVFFTLSFGRQTVLAWKQFRKGATFFSQADIDLT
jgi:hypothetical protein